MHKGQGVQIIYGPRVTVIKSDLEDYLASVTEEHFEDDAAENNTAGADEVKNENAASATDSKTEDSSTASDKAQEAADTKEPTKGKRKRYYFFRDKCRITQCKQGGLI